MEDVEKLRAEVAYWRGEMAAKLAFAMGFHRVALDKGDEKGARSILVTDIDPILNAFREADAGNFWHPLCVGCNQPVRDGQYVVEFADGDFCHLSCEDLDRQPLPGDEVHRPYHDCLTPERIEKLLADARALRGDDD